MTVIDLHAHVVLESSFGRAGAYGPELAEDGGASRFRVGEYEMQPCPYRGSVFMDVEKRLAGMDALGIDRQLLSPNPLSFFAGVEAEPAARFAAAANDAMAALVAKHSERLLGAAQVPLQDVAAAVAEAERAAELGLRAIYVGTNYPLPLDHADYDPFYSRLIALDLPLLIHPATNDGRSRAPDSRLGRFGLDLVVGYAYEETVTAATMILGGVFDRHPDLDVCIAHGGGAIAFLVERFDSMARFAGRPAGFGDALRRLWFDAHLEPGPARDLLIERVGTERMVYGTNFGGWDTPEQTDAFDASLTPNALRLLRLDRPEGETA